MKQKIRKNYFSLTTEMFLSGKRISFFLFNNTQLDAFYESLPDRFRGPLKESADVMFREEGI